MDGKDMEIEVSQLGLAAYIMMNGAKLVRVVGRSFILQTNKTVAEWSLDYSNSCCMKHDAMVFDLRKYLKG